MHRTASLALAALTTAIGLTSLAPLASAAPSSWRSTDCASGQITAHKAPRAPLMGASAVVKGTSASIQTQSPAPATAKLGVKDLKAGSGRAVKAGETVTVQYCGVALGSGKMFDSTYSRGGKPVSFPLAGLIKGWQDGLTGMKVGGVRLLVIPAEQAYGATPPAGSGIAPGETLVFTVALVS